MCQSRRDAKRIQKLLEKKVRGGLNTDEETELSVLQKRQQAQDQAVGRGQNHAQPHPVMTGRR